MPRPAPFDPVRKALVAACLDKSAFGANSAYTEAGLAKIRKQVKALEGGPHHLDVVKELALLAQFLAKREHAEGARQLGALALECARTFDELAKGWKKRKGG